MVENDSLQPIPFVVRPRKPRPTQVAVPRASVNVYEFFGIPIHFFSEFVRRCFARLVPVRVVCIGNLECE